MVFVMILIRINSSETSAACAAGVKCFFIHYSCAEDTTTKEFDHIVHLGTYNFIALLNFPNKTSFVAS